MKEEDKGWIDVVYHNGFYIKTRDGFIGRILDVFWPIKVKIREPAYYAIHNNGDLIESNDGLTWRAIKETNNQSLNRLS